jgi:hypothetical protein
MRSLTHAAKLVKHVGGNHIGRASPRIRDLKAGGISPGVRR